MHLSRMFKADPPPDIAWHSPRLEVRMIRCSLRIAAGIVASLRPCHNTDLTRRSNHSSIGILINMPAGEAFVPYARHAAA